MHYPDSMTKRSDQPLDFPASRPVIGRRITRAAAPEIDKRPPEPIDPAHVKSVERGLEQARRGQYATDAEVEASFALFDP